MDFLSLSTMILGIITAIATTTAFGSLLRRKQKESLAELEKVTELIDKENSGIRISLQKELEERIPQGLSSEQFSKLLDRLDAQSIPVIKNSPLPSKLVENQISSYHQQAIDQAKIQFWFGVVAASIGFIWILVIGSSGEIQGFQTLVRILPGIVVDSVSILFLRQAEDTRRRATELFDRLRKDKQMTEATALVSTISDQRLQSVVRAQLALHMAGLEPKVIDFVSFISGGIDKAKVE